MDGQKTHPCFGELFKVFLLQRTLGTTSVALLRTFRVLPKELRNYCDFDKLPDMLQFSRFKSEFVDYIGAFFELLVDLTGPICRELDSKKFQYMIYDTTDIESYAKENNDKFFNILLKLAKSTA
mgnify:CR=1 FL=1